jgi:hypothetical protein
VSDEGAAVLQVCSMLPAHMLLLSVYTGAAVLLHAVLGPALADGTRLVQWLLQEAQL